MKTSLLLTITFLTIQLGLAQNTITINPNKDNTLYESATGDVSNGAGDFLFFGKTNGGDIRRALISFDISGALQPSDSIIDVSLTFEVSKVPPGNTNRTANIHRLSQDWGEGSSNAGGDEGQGTTATNGDATWTQAFFGGTAPIPWNNAGGDFDANASGSISVGGTGSYSVTSAQMILDAQDWLTNPGNNFGWIIIGDEAANQTAKRINSRENASNPVSLDVTFVRPVALNSSMVESAVNIYPNPVQSTFELNASDDLISVELMDLNGKVKKRFNGNAGSYNIQDLERGIYLLRMEMGDRTVTQKLIKE